MNTPGKYDGLLRAWVDGKLVFEKTDVRMRDVDTLKIETVWLNIYYEDWGRMGREGHGLSCEFPQKWMSADGLTMWSIFSVYGEGAKQGINAHDKFNLLKVTLSLAIGR